MNFTRSMWHRIRNKMIRCLGIDRDFKRSYSQMAEDMIAANFLGHQEKGFYVDIGAYHPRRFSNTYYFYRKGWKGINVDASEAAVRLLQQARKRDVSVRALIGSGGEKVRFYEFAQRELNTMREEALPDILKYHGQKPVLADMLDTISLEHLLDRYLPAGQQIDLMNIDTEGADEEVLRSNNWQKYRPILLIVERHAALEDFLASELYKMLQGYQYRLYGYCKHAFILKSQTAT